MPVTPNKSIAYPDSTYPVAPLENLFSAMATSIDTALTSLQQITESGVPNQAARDALFPSPVANNQVFRLDTGQTDRYNGTAWQQVNEVFNATPSGSSAAIPSAGTLGICGGVTLASVPWARKVTVSLHATGVAFSGAYADVILRKDGTAVTPTSRMSALYDTANVTFSEIVPANTSTVYAPVCTTPSGTTVTITNNASLTGMIVETVSM